MCVIIIADKKNPPKSLLKKAEDHNRDGAGIAWIDQKEGCVRLIKGKNLTAKKIKKLIFHILTLNIININFFDIHKRLFLLE